MMLMKRNRWLGLLLVVVLIGWGVVSAQEALRHCRETEPWAWSRPVDFPLECPPGVQPEDVQLCMILVLRTYMKTPWKRDWPFIGVKYDQKAGVHRAYLCPGVYHFEDCVAAPTGKTDPSTYEHLWHVSSLVDGSGPWIIPMDVDHVPADPFVAPVIRLSPALSLQTDAYRDWIDLRVDPCEGASRYRYEFYSSVGPEGRLDWAGLKMPDPGRLFCTLDTDDIEARVNWRSFDMLLVDGLYSGLHKAANDLVRMMVPDGLDLGVSCRAVAYDPDGNVLNESGAVVLGQRHTDLVPSSTTTELRPWHDGEPVDSGVQLEVGGTVTKNGIVLRTDKTDKAETYVFRLFLWPSGDGEAGWPPDERWDIHFQIYGSNLVLVHPSSDHEIQLRPEDLRPGLAIYVADEGWQVVRPGWDASDIPTEGDEPVRTVTGVEGGKRWMLFASVNAWDANVNRIGSSPPTYIGDMPEDYFVGVRYRRLPDWQ